jgi:hypothetical protein
MWEGSEAEAIREAWQEQSASERAADLSFRMI